MIYRISSPGQEYTLTGSPGADIREAFARFKGGLSECEEERRQQLLDVLEYCSPGAVPTDEDLLQQAFITCLCANSDLMRREMITVDLRGV